MNEIDHLRILIWLDQVKRLTGCQTIKELAGRLDPGSVWRDEEGYQHHSKWYQYAKGVQVPSAVLVRNVERKLGKVAFDLHHPIWRALRRNCSDRTWSRIASQIIVKYGDTCRAISTVQLDQPSSEIELFELLAVSKATYLDALALFLLDRRRATALRDHARVDAIGALLAILPVLYAEDVIWEQRNQQQLAEVIGLFDRVLGIEHLRVDHLCGGRSAWILAQRWDIFEHRRRYASALKSPVALRRFLAVRLEAHLQRSLEV